MEGYIYSLIDPRDNNIKYIGQTKFSLNKRYLEHLRNSKYYPTKKHNVYCWINELKNNNLLPIIKKIETVNTELLNEREKYWVAYYNKQLKNMTKGGDGISYIEKRSFSKEHRKNIGDSCRGNKHYNYGKPANNIKSICNFDKTTGKLLNTYNSIKDAANDTKISYSAIGLCLSAQRNSSGEYIWLYKDEYYNNQSILKEKIIKCINNPSNKIKSIGINQINIKTNKIVNTYTSIRQAARSINTSDTAIRYVCNKSKTHIYKNFKWELILN
jgi:hypothetical protein